MIRMWRVLLMALSMASAASAQTIYTWTDSRGTVHYTDDPSTIPANAKAKTTEGDELSNMGPAPERPAPQPQAAASQQQPASGPAAGTDEEYWRKEFRAANEKVRSLEDELAVDQRKYDDPSRMPMGGNYYCQPGFYAPGFVSPGFVGPRSGQFSRSQTNFGAALNVPLGGGGSLNVNANAGASIRRGSSVAPFAGYGGYSNFGYGYGGYGVGVGGPCWYQMDGQYAYTRDRIDRTKQALVRAKEDLADLERRAANASVPLEWRR